MIARLFAPLAMKVAGGAIVALLTVVVGLLIQIHGLPVVGGGLIARLDRMTELRRIEADNHRKTKQVYRAAMAQAQWLEQVRLARVRAEHERNNERAKELFNRRVTLLRQRYDSLRAQARARTASAAGDLAMPALPQPAFGIDEASAADRLLAEQLECSVNAVQLDGLITWVEDNIKIKVND